VSQFKGQRYQSQPEHRKYQDEDCDHALFPVGDRDIRLDISLLASCNNGTSRQVATAAVRGAHDVGPSMSELIRLRYNTMADQTPGGEFKRRIILERGHVFEEVLVKELFLNVPSFSKSDQMPVVGRKHHMACYGVLSVRDDIGYVEPQA
jgi:hypothetical protein